MVAAFKDSLPASLVALDGFTVVKHLIAGFDHQEVASGRDFRRFKRAQLGEVFLGEFKRRAGVQVGLRAEVFFQRSRRGDGRIDQRSAQQMFFRQPGGVIAAERAEQLLKL